MKNTTVEKINSEVVKYDVVALNGRERELTFYDTNLINHTKAIQGYRDAGNLAVLAIAAEMDAIESDKSYEKAGFKSVAEYAQVVFDYKPATVSLYLRSARAFLEKTDNPTDPIRYKGNIPHITMGQMIELLPLVEKETDISRVEKAFVDGEVNQRMSTKDIRGAVSGIRGITAKKKETHEKTAIEKAGKLGEYDKESLPKNTTPLMYAGTNIESALMSLDNVAKALGDIEHNNTIDSKLASVIKSLQEIRAEILK